MQIEIKILDPRLETPEWALEYQTAGAAGLDVRACLERPIMLFPGETLMIPLGFALHIADPSVCAVLLPRSGLGHREGIVLGNLVGLVDSDYQGQVSASVWNRSAADTPAFMISPGDRIAQLVFLPVIRPELTRVEDFTPTARGAGGFGNTGLR